MFDKLFKKCVKTSSVNNSVKYDEYYYMDTDKYRERTDNVYEYARIIFDEKTSDSDNLLRFGYDIICKLAENNNLCYYVAYDEKLPEHNEVIECIKNNFKNGDIYSIIYSANDTLLCIRQSNPSAEIMQKAGKDGWNYTSGVNAYIYKGIRDFSVNKDHNAVDLLGTDKQYMINITINDHMCCMKFKYDKSLITFNEIKAVAQETAQKHGKHLEVEI